MTAERWQAVSFGATLALVVGLRLSAAELLLLGGMLALGVLISLRQPRRRPMRQRPVIRIERPRRAPLGGRGGAAERRGGWPHLEWLLEEAARLSSGPRRERKEESHAWFALDG